ncbi:hypothetical protein [Labrys neptuniae]
MLQLWTKALASQCCNKLPADLVACAPQEAMKSPVHANAAGLPRVGRSDGSNRAFNRRVRSTATGQIRNVAATETDFGKVLSGPHPSGLQALLIGPVRLTADAQIGKDAGSNHRHFLEFTVCCGAT